MTMPNSEEQAIVDAAAPAEDHQAGKKSHERATEGQGWRKGRHGRAGQGQVGKKATPPMKSPKTAKAAKPAQAEAGAPREDSKTAQVVAMLQRKNRATPAEIALTMSRCALRCSLPYELPKSAR
jgi:hypothetical protein